MKKILYILPILALALASCGNYFDEKQLDNDHFEITDVKKFAYTLTDNDYPAIASNATNVATVLNMAEDSSLLTILQAVGTNKYFSDTTVTPDLVIPAFMAKKYPYLSSGTTCEVTYNIVADQPLYYADFAIIREVALKATPADDAEAAAALDTLVSNKSLTRKYIVYYSPEVAKVFKYNGTAFELYANASLDVVVAIPQTIYEKAGFYSTNRSYIEADNAKKVINTYLSELYPYAREEMKVAVVYYQNANDMVSATIKEFNYDGATWVMTEDVIEETMSFEMKNVWKANTSTYLSETFIGHGWGDFIAQNVTLTGDLTYVWYYSASYGMCASAYKSSTNNESESWLVSPAVKLKKAKKPALIFDQARKYGVTFEEECTVWCSTDYAGDVTTCTWKQLPWNKKEDGTLNVPDGTSWVFQSSGYMDMTEFAGKTVYLGFKYTSSTAGAATWELKNLLVCEVEETAAE